MKRLKRMLEIGIGALAGAYIGLALGDIQSYFRFRALYAADSAPWYTGLLVRTLFMLLIAVLWAAVYIAVRRRAGKQKRRAATDAGFCRAYKPVIQDRAARGQGSAAGRSLRGMVSGDGIFREAGR